VQVFAFFGDADLNGLRALELRAGIEETALLAAVEFEIAFGAFSVGIKTGHENGSAIGATSAGNCSDHARGAGAEVIGGATGAALGRLAIRFIFLLLLVLPFGVAIAAVTILAIHKCLRPSVLTDCNYTMYNSDLSILVAM
jgi:hypothetical protein